MWLSLMSKEFSNDKGITKDMMARKNSVKDKGMTKEVMTWNA